MPVLRTLHWLPVCQRIVFKIAMLVYKCLLGLAPSYLAEQFIPLTSIAGRRQLQFAANFELFDPPTRTATLWPRTFAVSGPKVFNSLTSNLRDANLTSGANSII